MNLNEILKTLAKGINPESGKSLGKNSIANTPEAIRLLFSLADEFAPSKNPAAQKAPKLTSEERRQKNILEGKPARSHFPWDTDEEKLLLNEFNKKREIENLAKKFERSDLSIAAKLEKMGLIDKNELEKYQASAM